MIICLDLRYRVKGGVSTYISNLVPHILKQDTKNEYGIIRYSDQSFDFENRVKFVIISSMKSDIKDLIWTNFTLPKLLKNNSVDVLHGMKWTGPLLLSIPIIFTAHGNTADWQPTNLKTKVYIDLYHHPAIKRVQKIIAISRYIKGYLTDLLNIPDERIDVIYNGIRPKFFPVSDSEWTQIKRKYGISKRYLICVGNINEVKNHITAVKTIHLLASDFDLQLVIVGRTGSSYYHQLEGLVQELGLDERVLMPGFLTGLELFAITKNSFLMLFPSFTEGFPIAMLEAMAEGIPVIAAEQGGMIEAGEGCAAFVKSPLDFQGFAAQVRLFLESEELYKVTQEKSKEMAKKYTWETSAKQHIEIYESFSINAS